MFGRSPQPFVPPIPPDQTSSAESSPILRNGVGLPSEGGHRGGPGGMPGQGYPGYPPYDFPDHDPKEDMGHYMMQRWAAPTRRPANTNAAAGGNTRGGGANAPSMVPRGYYGGGGYGFAPPATPGPTYGYGFSPYPQPSPYPYQTPGGGGYPFGMYGGQGMMPPQPFMTPFMTPVATPGVLDPPGMAAPTAGHHHHMPHAGGMGATIARPGAGDTETSVGKWMPGADYAPVLDPLGFSVVKPPVIELHPLLRPIPESRDNAEPHLVFDLLFPPNTIHLSNERPTKSWSKGRSAPAVFPRVKLMRIITKYTPWIIQVTSDGPSGVTVYDVIQAIHDHYRINASQQDDWERADQSTKAEILIAYKWNRSTEPGAPGGVMSDALLRGDFLMERTQYAGLRLASPELCEEKLDVKNLPATFELLLHVR